MHSYLRYEANAQQVLSRGCWRHQSAWGWRVAGKRHPSLSQVRGQHPTCPPQGCWRHRLALVRQPTRCCLLPGHGCPVSSSSGEEGGGANPDVPLPPQGDVVVEFAAAERADDRRCCRAARGGVPCRSCNALNLGVEFFLLFSHQIQALLFPFSLFFSPSLDIFKSYSEN
jgi:hypothetical protein